MLVCLFTRKSFQNQIHVVTQRFCYYNYTANMLKAINFLAFYTNHVIHFVSLQWHGTCSHFINLTNTSCSKCRSSTTSLYWLYIIFFSKYVNAVPFCAYQWGTWILLHSFSSGLFYNQEINMKGRSRFSTYGKFYMYSLHKYIFSKVAHLFNSSCHTYRSDYFHIYAILALININTQLNIAFPNHISWF